MSEDLGTDSPATTHLRADELEQLVRAHAGAILATCTRLLGCERAAADVVREAFLSADLRQGDNAGEALDHTALKAALARLERRDNGHGPRAAVHDVVASLLHAPAPGPPDLADVSPSLVRAQIGQLPPRHRAVLILRDVERRCPVKVASVMDTDEAEVSGLLHEARRVLRELLVRASNAR